jgi:hypothetical protein
MGVYTHTGQVYYIYTYPVVTTGELITPFQRMYRGRRIIHKNKKKVDVVCAPLKFGWAVLYTRSIQYITCTQEDMQSAVKVSKLI